MSSGTLLISLGTIRRVISLYESKMQSMVGCDDNVYVQLTCGPGPALHCPLALDAEGRSGAFKTIRKPSLALPTAQRE